MNVSEDILNYGLQLSMEFGENWLKDTQDRIRTEYPELTLTELTACDKLFQKVQKAAHDLVRNNPEKSEGPARFMPLSKFKPIITTKYGWIDETNLSKLYSQSCYYAMK